MELPEELRRLEDDLGARVAPRPAPALRAKVLETVRKELGAAGSRRIVRGGLWSLAAAAAAALLWANLSMAGANMTDWNFAPRDAQPSLAEEAEALRTVLPELSDRDALGRALALRSGRRLLVLPVVSGSGGGHTSAPKEDE